LEDKKNNSEIIFNFLDFFWPNFIVYKGHVFLKENSSEEKFNDLQKQNLEMVEFWMNLLITDPFFENEENGEEKAKSLAGSLVDIWQVKLKNEFPDLQFSAKYVEDAENGDYGLTFYRDEGR